MLSSDEELEKRMEATYEKIKELQKAADIQVHVEGLSLKARLTVHQSFSTKLVDLFALGKCIFVVGPRDVASVSHLLKNDAAIVASEENEVYIGITHVTDDKNKYYVHDWRSPICNLFYELF